MSKVLPLQGLLRTSNSAYPPSKQRLYLTREQAIEALKRITSKKFETYEEWKAYLSSIRFDLNNIDSVRLHASLKDQES